MPIELTRLLKGGLNRFAYSILDFSSRLQYFPVKIISREENTVTCKVRGIVWKLDARQHVDLEILNKGVFERDSIKWLNNFIKPGMVAADVGANFGYYTVQISRLVGPSGKVYGFEPSARFRNRLTSHLKENHCENVTVLDYGLSDLSQSFELFGSGDTATLHWSDTDSAPTHRETIKVRRLDDFVEEEKITRLDFVKIDIDGHEPKFLEGAKKTLVTFKPILLIEFAEMFLSKAGSDSIRLGEELHSLGYVLSPEDTLKPFSSQMDFIRATKNFSHSINVICIPKEKR